MLPLPKYSIGSMELGSSGTMSIVTRLFFNTSVP
jgi:hypothetical protein